MKEAATARQGRRRAVRSRAPNAGWRAEWSEGTERNGAFKIKILEGQPVRICVVCRAERPISDLIRLTVEHGSGKVLLSTGKSRPQGRSAYLCRLPSCIDQATKTAKLKGALEGRKVKGLTNKRTVAWPLEPQLIQLLMSQCTEPQKTCQNTHIKESP